MSNNLYSKLGIFIIILGFIGAIGIITSFDWETWNEAKEYESVYEAEIAMLKPQLTSTWTTAITAFLGSVVLGAILMALGKIVELLQESNERLRLSKGNREQENRTEYDKHSHKQNEDDLEQGGSQRINWY